MENKNTIIVEAIVKAPVEKVWLYWTLPEHIKQWNNASDDWHTPYAENDWRAGGKFLSTMAAKDGSESFDFTGVYDAVEENKLLRYTIADGRKVAVTFTSEGNDTRLSETFDMEDAHSAEMQQAGWQAILDNFKRYTEAH